MEEDNILNVPEQLDEPAPAIAPVPEPSDEPIPAIAPVPEPLDAPAPAIAPVPEPLDAPAPAIAPAPELTDAPAPAEWTDEPQIIAAEKKPSRKGLWIGAACLLLAVLAAGAWWLFGRGRKLARLETLGLNTLARLEELTDGLPNLKTALTNFKALTDAETMHGQFDFLMRIDYPYGEGYASGAAGTMSYDLKAKRVLADLTVLMDDLTVPITLYYDEDQLQIGSSTLLNKGEALALPVKDFGARWNASAWAEMTGLTLPEDFGLPSIAEQRDMEKLLTEAYGKTWTDFADSLAFGPLKEGEDPFDGAGKTYALTWDRSLLEKLHQASSTKAAASVGLENLYSSMTGTSSLVDLLWKCGSDLDRVLFRVEGDLITGLWLSTRPEAEAELDTLELRLLGADNPWSRFSVRMVKDEGGVKTEEVSETTLRCEDGRLILSEQVQGEDRTVSIVYEDADGSFSYHSGEPGEEPEKHLFLKPVEDGVRISADFDIQSSVDRGEEPYLSTYAYSTSIRMMVEYAAGAEAIAPLSEKPTQLLDLSQVGLGILAMRIMNNLGIDPFELLE